MKKIAILLLISLTTSCASSTTYRPKIYGHDFQDGSIIAPKTHERISCSEFRFNEYVSISLDDLAKLALALKNAKLPRHIRIIIEDVNRELRQLKTEQLLSVSSD